MPFLTFTIYLASTTHLAPAYPCRSALPNWPAQAGTPSKWPPPNHTQQVESADSSPSHKVALIPEDQPYPPAHTRRPGSDPIAIQPGDQPQHKAHHSNHSTTTTGGHTHLTQGTPMEHLALVTSGHCSRGPHRKSST